EPQEHTNFDKVFRKPPPDLQESENAQRMPINFGQLSNALEELEDSRLANLNAWDLETERVAAKVDHYYREILRVVSPELNPEWETGFMTGPAPDFLAVMQAECDPYYLTRQFKQRTLPIDFDWAAQIVVDTSPSITMIGAARPQFKAVVFLCELLERLKFSFEAGEFSSGMLWHKEFSDKMAEDSVRSNLSKIEACSGGSTLDGDAIHEAFLRLREAKAKHKLMVLFSDADSVQPMRLREVINEMKEEGSTLLVHYGLGAQSVDVNHYYPVSYGGLSIDGRKVDFSRSGDEMSEEQAMGEQFAMSMAVGQDEDRRLGPDFYEVFYNTIVDILLKPNVYLERARLHKSGKGFLP
ncbi:MAG: VWA domain-containing protein, partial [Bdellovibrionales bacterium]|nr:VWA domain-containing protein [Bdellovibrionales bacterium]